MKSSSTKLPCPNCGTTRHEICCARCGVLTYPPGPFCGKRCARKQAESDAKSAKMKTVQVSEIPEEVPGRITVDEGLKDD